MLPVAGKGENQELGGRCALCSWETNTFILQWDVARARVGKEGRHLKTLVPASALFNDLFLNIPGRNALHVDVDVSSGFIYWCDFSISEKSYNAIRRIKPDGSGFTNIVTHGIGENGVRGVAVDWVAGR